MRTWALELECAKVDEQIKEEEGVDEKVNPYPFIWADETMRPH